MLLSLPKTLIYGPHPRKKPAAVVEEVKETPSKPEVKVNTAAAAIENCSPIQFKYAQLMNVEVETISNTRLYEVIEEWWATRYRYGGTTKKGIDCSAFTGTLINETFGLVLPRTARNQYAQCEKVSRDGLQEGDLVFFNTRGGVSHAGVYLNNGYFVHSSVSSGVTISSLNEAYYSRKFIGGGRIVK